jgi:hypothetical protein
MEPFYVFFIMFSPLWWLLVLGACVAIIAALENERGTWATITLVSTLVLLNFFGTTPLLSWIVDKPWWFLGGIVGFFAVGGVWGVPVSPFPCNQLRFSASYFSSLSTLKKYHLINRNSRCFKD